MSANYRRMAHRVLRQVDGLTDADRSWLVDYLECYVGARDDEEHAVRRLGEIVVAAKRSRRTEDQP